MGRPFGHPRVGGLNLGQGYYWEVLLGASVAADDSVGIIGASLPADGSEIRSVTKSVVVRSAGNAFTLTHEGFATGAAFTDADVISVLVRGGYVWLAKNGTMMNSGLPFIGGLTGTWRPAGQLNANAGLTMTARFATASWTYSPPPGFATIGDSAVWADENSVTLTDAGLTANSGTVAARTPFRADTGFTIVAAATSTKLTLANLT